MTAIVALCIRGCGRPAMDARVPKCVVHLVREMHEILEQLREERAMKASDAEGA